MFNQSWKDLPAPATVLFTHHGNFYRMYAFEWEKREGREGQCGLRSSPGAATGRIPRGLGRRGMGSIAAFLFDSTSLSHTRRRG